MAFVDAEHACVVKGVRAGKVGRVSVSNDGRVIGVIGEKAFLASIVRIDGVIDPTPQPDTIYDDPQHQMQSSVPEPKKIEVAPKTFYQLIEDRTESSFFNRNKLKGFLNHYGGYPDQYRQLIWRFLLKLPENRSGYESLLDQGTHPSFKNFRSKFPLKSDRAARSMERMLSCLAYWSPVFEDLEYLPALVFPFVKLFWNDLFSCLEVVMTILVNWCQKWWEYYPNPPIELLEMQTSLVIHHDPELGLHLQKSKIGNHVYGWTMMQSLFSELFSKPDWMVVWDHLVSNPPSFMYSFTTAYIIHFRVALLSINDPKDFYYFFQRRNVTNIPSLILKAYEIKRTTPSTIAPSTFLKAFEPIKPGSYPVFNAYPHFIVNYQSRMKDKIRAEENEYIRSRQLASELNRLTTELKQDQKTWEKSDIKMNGMIEVL